jgi:hypothetical protein
LVKFKKVGGQITLFMIGEGQKVFPKLPTRQKSNGIHPFIRIQINTGGTSAAQWERSMAAPSRQRLNPGGTVWVNEPV